MEENKLSEGQQAFLSEVMAGANVFLTGKAGTGKSFIVRRAMDELKTAGKNVIALAPTGVAANNIGGQTLHSFFSLNPFGVIDRKTVNHLKSEKRRLINKVDVMVIDEVSMFRPDLFDAIEWTLEKNKCKKLEKIQIILVGDLEQLEAPMDDNFRSILLQIYKGVEYFHAGVCERIAIKTIELDEVLRQKDMEFIENLNIIRNKGRSEYFRQFVNSKPRGIILAPHNATVAAYNINGLISLEGPEITFEAVIKGNVKASDFNLESKVTVKHGCKIMYLANSKNNNLVNGTLGIFVNRENVYFIEVAGVEYALEKVEFTKKEYVLNNKADKLELQELGSITQYPIKLAYALTIHKAQGLTFDEVTVDLTLPCFSKGQMYTALSRVTSPQGLTIITN